MTKILRGIIHGKTIELENDTGLEDGRNVEVVLFVQRIAFFSPRASLKPPGFCGKGALPGAHY